MIEVRCACGKSFRVPDGKAGARGKCPACAQPLVVPAAAPPAPRILPIEPIEPRVASSAPPVARPRPGRVLTTRKGEADDGPRGFVPLVLRIYVSPIRTMESLTWFLASPPMLVKMALFWAGSLVVVFLNAGLGVGKAVESGRTERPAPRPPVVQPATGPTAWATQNGKLEQKGEGLRVTMTLVPDPPIAGVDVGISCEAVDEKTGAPFEGELRVLSLKRLVHTPGGDAAPIPQPSPFTLEGPGGTWHSDLEVQQNGEYALSLGLVPAPPEGATAGEPPFSPTFSFHASSLEDMQLLLMAQAAAAEDPVEEEATAPRRGFSVLAGLFAVFASALGLLITTTTVNLAGRVIGSGGGFLAMLVVMAFLTGLVNYTQVLLLAVAPALGTAAVWYAGWVFWMWQTALFLLALMKVYDVDFMFAVGIALLSNVLQLFGAFWIVVTIQKVFAS